MKAHRLSSLALPKTAIWMMSARLGPIGAGLAAAAILPAPEYGHYVIALAWLGGLVAILAGSAQALVARANQPAQDLSEDPTIGTTDTQLSHVLRQSFLASLLVPIGLGLLFIALDYRGSFILAIVLAGLFSTQNACLGALLWGSRRINSLSLACLSESLLTILAVGLGAFWGKTVEAALWGLALANFLSWLIYVRSIGGFGALLRLWKTSDPDGIHLLQGVLGPSLVNGAAGAAGPAIALVIAAIKEPASAGIYGVWMLLIAAGLFPIQILGIALSPPLIAWREQARKKLAVFALLGGVGWGFLSGAGLFLLGPIVMDALGVEVLAEHNDTIFKASALAALLIFCLCPIATIGPIVQADGRYWTWAYVNAISAVIFIGVTLLWPPSLVLALYACLVAALFRLGIGLPLAFSCVFRWHRQT